MTHAHTSTQTPEQRAALPTLALAMIVKDEEAVIARSFNSVAGVIDTYAIVDTGSTDDTENVIARTAEAAGISGSVIRDAWRGFGPSRTVSLEAARKVAKWAIVIDADDSLECAMPRDELHATLEKLDRDNVAGAYVMILCANLKFQRIQIFNLRFPWAYAGVVHELPVCAGSDNPIATLDKLHYVVREEGARSKDPLKYQKDADALEAAYAEKPDPRTCFYAAQSHRAAGNFDTALEWYARRCGELHGAGYMEEEYVSAYQVLRHASFDLERDIRAAWDKIVMPATRVSPARVEVFFNFFARCESAGMLVPEHFWFTHAYAAACAPKVAAGGGCCARAGMSRQPAVAMVLFQMPTVTEHMFDAVMARMALSIGQLPIALEYALSAADAEAATVGASCRCFKHLPAAEVTPTIAQYRSIIRDIEDRMVAKHAA
jgi:glycosyltransferase involved in cell wall biosynthesis